MKHITKISTIAVILMFFAASIISAQKHSKSAKTNNQMMQNMQGNCDSTMMSNHKAMMMKKGMMKDGMMNCDSTMMSNHKAMMMKKGMMKDGMMNCDSTMMSNHKAMMMKKGMMKDGMMNCDSTMMSNHKTMMMKKGMMKDGAMMNHKAMLKNNNGMMDQGNMKNSKMESSIVHKGVINVAAIDKNKDGKVYQDTMDWNVISDKPGKCPNCGMTLKEVTIEQAIKNLKNNGFETK